MKLQVHARPVGLAPTPSRPLPDRFAGARRAGLTLALLLAAALSLRPLPASAQARLVYRSLDAQGASAEPQPLQPGGTVELGATPYEVSGVTSLRIASPDASVRVALRFRPDVARPGTLVLTVIVDARHAPHEYLYRADAQVLEGGRLLPQRRFKLDEDLVTALDGEPGQVQRIAIQDDDAAELRLTQRAGELVLEVLTPDFGGAPSGGARPYYYGQRLHWQDYRVLGAGWLDNGYGELWLFDTFGTRLSGFLATNQTQVLAQGLVRQPLTRWERISLWLEGGAAYHNLDAPNASAQRQQVVTWVLGGSLHWRRQNWGALLHLALVKDQPYMLLQGGWQAFEHVGAVLVWQSFEGFSGFGLGASANF